MLKWLREEIRDQLDPLREGKHDALQCETEICTRNCLASVLRGWSETWTRDSTLVRWRCWSGALGSRDRRRSDPGRWALWGWALPPAGALASEAPGLALGRRLLRFVHQADPSYDRHVTEQAQAVLATALRLTVKERAELAAELLASLDGEPDEDVEAAWAAEIERRVRRLEVEGSRGRDRAERSLDGSN